jgi:hypothetical protein
MNSQKTLTSLIEFLALSGGRDKVSYLAYFRLAESYSIVASFLPQNINNNMIR